MHDEKTIITIVNNQQKSKNMPTNDQVKCLCYFSELICINKITVILIYIVQHLLSIMVRYTLYFKLFIVFLTTDRDLLSFMVNAFHPRIYLPLLLLHLPLMQIIPRLKYIKRRSILNCKTCTRLKIYGL